MHDLLKRAAELANGMPPESFSIIHELIAEVERLRSNWRQEHATAEIWKEDFRKMKKALQESELLRQAQYNQITANNARIKELEAEAQEYHDIKEEALTLYAGQNRYIEGLEAAFLKAESQRLWDLGKSTGKTSYDCQEAREALERIKAETGSGDHVAGANKLILTAEQREEEGKRDA